MYVVDKEVAKLLTRTENGIMIVSKTNKWNQKLVMQADTIKISEDYANKF